MTRSRRNGSSSGPNATSSKALDMIRSDRWVVSKSVLKEAFDEPRAPFFARSRGFSFRRCLASHRRFGASDQGRGHRAPHQRPVATLDPGTTWISEHGVLHTVMVVHQTGDLEGDERRSTRPTRRAREDPRGAGRVPQREVMRIGARLQTALVALGLLPGMAQAQESAGSRAAARRRLSHRAEPGCAGPANRRMRRSCESKSRRTVCGGSLARWRIRNSIYRRRFYFERQSPLEVSRRLDRTQNSQ